MGTQLPAQAAVAGRCPVSNGTYKCHLIAGHEGRHKGAAVAPEWVDRYSRVNQATEGDYFARFIAALDRINAASALHVPDQNVTPMCVECAVLWPCRTSKALQGNE